MHRTASAHKQVEVHETVVSLSEPFRELLHISINRYEDGIVLHGGLADNWVFGSLVESFTVINHDVASSVDHHSHRIGDAFIKEEPQFGALL